MLVRLTMLVRLAITVYWLFIGCAVGWTIFATLKISMVSIHGLTTEAIILIAAYGLISLGIARGLACVGFKLPFFSLRAPTDEMALTVDQ